MDFKSKQRLINSARYDPFDMNNYVDIGFTSSNNGLEEYVKEEKDNKDDYKREDVIQAVFGKKESELNEEEKENRDDSDLQRQAREDYELRQNNYFGFIWKRFNQGKDKNAAEFIAQKSKEIFFDKPLDYVTNNPVSKLLQDIYGYFSSLIENKYLFLIGFVVIIILIKKV